MTEQEKLLSDLWSVYHGDPVYETNFGMPQEVEPERILARALIALLENAQLPDEVSIPS